MGMMMTKVLVMVVMMMIPMKSSSMATISPLREGISLADSCLPERFLSLCVFRPAEAADSIYYPSLGLRFSGRRYMRGGAGRGRLGRPHHWVRAA
jgi:hypothetical protein